MTNTSYYKGTLPYDLEPHHVAEHLNYNIATAVVYLLRSPYKHEEPHDDYIKAINHIIFELNKLGICNDKILHSLEPRGGREPDSRHTGAYWYQKSEEGSMEKVSAGESGSY